MGRRGKGTDERARRSPTSALPAANGKGDHGQRVEGGRGGGVEIGARDALSMLAAYRNLRCYIGWLTPRA